MYEYLEGDLVRKTPSRIVLDVGGVGFSIAIPLSTHGGLPARGRAKVLIHYHVVEDGPRLYGFVSEEERALFRLLIGVSGVGPQTGIALLSQVSPAELAHAVANDDAERLRRIRGVGEKTAKRILLELKEKLPRLGIEGGSATVHPPAFQDAVNALLSIGFDRKEAETAVQRAIKKTGSKPLEEIVKAAIAESSSR